MHLYQEEAQFLIKLIGQNIEDLVFLIVDNLFDATNVELVIKIDFLPVCHVDVDSIFRR